MANVEFRQWRERRNAAPGLLSVSSKTVHVSKFSVAVMVSALWPLLGQIEVRTNFEGGSLGKVTTVSASHLRCAVPGQADKDGRNRQADWYYFELTNLPSTPVTIDLVDLAGEYDYKAPAFSVTKGTRPGVQLRSRPVAALSRRRSGVGQPGATPQRPIYTKARSRLDRPCSAVHEQRPGRAP